MGVGLLKAHLEAFDAIGTGIADKRRDGYDKLYEYADAIKGAYGIFFFQHPSMLEYQERLKSEKGRSNAESILRVSKIPCGNQITRLLDAMLRRDDLSVASNVSFDTHDEANIPAFLSHLNTLNDGVFVCVTSFDSGWPNVTQGRRIVEALREFGSDGRGCVKSSLIF